MKNFKPPAATRLALSLFGAALLVTLCWPLTVAAQDNTPDPGTHKQVDQQPSGDQNLTAQLGELHAKVARLEAALAKLTPPAGDPGDSGSTPDGGKSGGQDIGAMGGDKAEMDGTGGATMAMMDQQMMQMMQMMQQVMEMKITGIKSQAGQGMGGGMGMDMKDKGMDMKDKGMDMKDKPMDMKDKGMDMKDKPMAMKEKGMGKMEKGMGMMAKDKTKGMGNMEGGKAEAGGSASGRTEQQVKQMMQMQSLQMKMMEMKMKMMEMKE
jgi:hypothetical protein